MQRATSNDVRRLARETIELEATSLDGYGPDAPAGSGGQVGAYDTAEFDELYDRVLARLRRDLIIERERRGDLAGAYFRY